MGAVDADAHKSLGQQYGIRGFPTIKVFGTNKQSPTDYQGGRTADAIVDQVISQLKTIANERLGKRGGGGGSSGGSGGSGGKDAIDLTDSNFQVNHSYLEYSLKLFSLIFSRLSSIPTNHGLLNSVCI